MTAHGFNAPGIKMVRVSIVEFPIPCDYLVKFVTKDLALLGNPAATS